MNTFKKLSIALISSSLILLQGCAVVTGPSDPSKSAYTSENKVSQDHKYHNAIRVGKTEGFAGTSAIVLMGKVSPNLSNESAKQVIESSLDSAGMLASSDSNAKYELDAKMIEDGAMGYAGGGSTFSGLSRDMQIQFVLKQLSNLVSLYDEVVECHGEASFSDGKVFYYLQERIASERSYSNCMKSMITDLAG
ncbi:hypothetical protein [Salinicola rhizosphaerae]|uniref:DUF3015 domain-containing protein n=1 Tax=Salinicola rhizosphaerae TaxID=1443141 RepID=A0ABQ3DTN8_9GAMM|nr:hypothetical protein [Salinicola rhizosphaerae]GHB12814.1 hypothetical protein GCM10009038_08530 [Salinicola rhizosphaerae]